MQIFHDVTGDVMLDENPFQTNQAIKLWWVRQKKMLGQTFNEENFCHRT